MPVDRSSVAAVGRVEALDRRSSGGTDLDVARRVIRAEIDGLEDLSEALGARFEDAVDACAAVRGRIIVTGIGKSGLATSFLIHAINQGYSGRYVLFAELLAQFYRSCADHSEAKLLSKYLSYDCLLIDEIGYVEVEAVQVGLFFTLMHKRHRKKPTLITSNLGLSEWGSFLKNAHLTAALIDRLTENSHVINMKQCISLRAKLGPES